MQINMIDNISATLHNMTDVANTTTTALQNMANATSGQAEASTFNSVNEQIQTAQQTVIKVVGIKAKAGLDSIIARLHSFQSQIQAVQQIAIKAADTKQARVEIDSVTARLHSFQSQAQAVQQAAIKVAGTKQARVEIESVTARLHSFHSQAQAVQQAAIKVADTKQARVEIDSVTARLHSFQGQAQAMQQTAIKVADTKQARVEIDSVTARLNSFQSQAQAMQQTEIKVAGTKQAKLEIDSVTARLHSFHSKMQAAQQTNIGNIGIIEISAEAGQLKQQLNSVLQVQRQLGTASSRMNISEVSKTYNRLNTTIANTRRYIDRKTMAQQRFNDAVHKKGNNATVITKAYDRLSTTIRNMRRYIDNNAMTQERFNGMINRGKKAAADLKNKFSGTAKVLQRIAKIGFGFTNASIDKAMQQAQVKQRLENSLRARGAGREQIIAVQQRAFEIQDTTMHSANSIMAGTRELSMVIKDIERLKNMMDVLANYAAAMTGGIAASESAMEGLARAMNKAIQQGDFGLLEQKTGVRFDLRDIAEMANVSQEDREYFIKYIIDSQLGENFAEQMLQTPQGMRDAMLKSIGAIRTAFGEQLLPAVTLLLSTIERHLPTINQMLRALAVPVGIVIGVLAGMANIVFTIAAAIMDNWSLIAPLILGIATSFAILNAQLIYKKITTGLLAIKNGILTAAITLLKFAKIGLKTVMMVLFPMKLAIALAVAAIVAIVYKAVGAINRFAGTSLSVAGAVGGAFAVLGAFIWNTVVGVINAVIQFLWTCFVEPWVSIIEWVLNVFNGGFDSFGDKVKSLLDNIIVWFMSLGTVVTKIIDAIFGTNWTAGLNAIRSSILSRSRNDNAITLSAYRSAPELFSRIEYGNAWNAGYDWANNLTLFGGNGSGDGSYPSYPGHLEINGLGAGGMGSIGGMADIANNVANIAHNTDRTAEITGENLKYWRDIAEREAINRFTTAEVKNYFGDINNIVNSNTDLDSIVDYIAEGVEEALQVTAEKSYA